jgi:galactonate dehydratase
MRIARLDTFLTNAGLRNYLFVRLTTDAGLTGIGEATLEWQEKTVETILHEWVESRVVGKDAFDIEAVIGGMIRDQYQGGSTVMTAISAVEIAMWDLIGKACGQPVYKLMGGRCHERIVAYANGWYGGAQSPEDFAERAADVVRRGYSAMKFDPFGKAWKELLTDEEDLAHDIIRAVRDAVEPSVQVMIEYPDGCPWAVALRMIRRTQAYDPAWCEETVVPESLDLLAEVKRQSPSPIAAGERLYTLADFSPLIALRAVDVAQMDIAHCEGISMAKKIAAMASVQDIQVSPHCSIGPVALAAALHFDLSTPNFMIQENFAEFDSPSAQRAGFGLESEPWW